MFALKRIAVLALQIAMFYGTMDTLRLSQMQRMRWSCRKMYQDEIACFLSLFPAQI